MKSEETKVSNADGDSVRPGEEGTARLDRIVSRRRPRIGIRLIVTLVAVVLTAASVIGVGAIQEHSTRVALTEELETRLLLEARNLALASSSALLSDFPELTLHPLLKEKQERNPEFRLLVVTDHESKIQGHPEFRLLGEDFAHDASLSPYTGGQQLLGGEGMLANTDLIVATTPVEYQDQEIGSCAVGIDRSYIDTIIHKARMKLLLVVGGILALAIGVVFLTMTGLLSPIDDLRKGIERIGHGDLDHPIDVKDGNELGLLAQTVNEMASQLKVAQAEMVEKERLTHELDLARDIQGRLLPHESRTAESFIVDGSHTAAFEVGGDYYDYFELDEGKMGVVVADVSGKGLAGCLVMSMVSAFLKAYRDRFESPAQLLGALDEALAPDLRPGMFVTMFYGILEPASGRFCFASAGHMPTLIYRKKDGEVEEIRSTGIPLGAVKGGFVARSLKDEWTELAPGDLMVQYTDGINETLGEDGETQFEIEGMVELLEREAPKGSIKVLESFQSSLETFRAGGPRQDDETLVTISRELPATSGSVDAEAKVIPFPKPGYAAHQGSQRTTLPTDATRREETGGFDSEEPAAQAEARELPAVAQAEATSHVSPVPGPKMAETPTDAAGFVDELGKSIPEMSQEEEALRWLDLARRCGDRVVLPTNVRELDCIEPWLLRRSRLENLEKAKVELLVTALYECCTNVAEHGYGVTGEEFELWWVPRQVDSEFEASILGHFVVLDDGLPFSAENWTASDFNDPAVRRRTRGFGLDIIHRVMSEVLYRPATSQGNITILAFDPDAVELKEVRHA